MRVVSYDCALLCPFQLQEVRAQTALWAAGFVIMTLLINAPLLTPLIKWLKLGECATQRSPNLGLQLQWYWHR